MQSDRHRQFPFAYVAGALIVLAYFIFFAWPGLRMHFAEDDPMNIYYYWSGGPWALLRNLVMFFTTYNRPMGGVFYYTLYSLFGLHPLPYHIVITCLLLLNVWLAYRFVSSLCGGGALLAGLCALAVAYHSAFAMLVYLPSFVYDVLCFTFYFLAFNYYLSIRGRGALLNARQTAAFLLLAIAALEAKEMAVTLPVMVLLYEVLWHPPASWRWLRREALPPLLLGVLTAVYIAGKSLLPGALNEMPAYQPQFTWARYFESTSRFLNEIFYRMPPDGGFFAARWRVLLLAALLLVLAWRMRRKHFRFACLFVLIAPLPITFLPGRGGGCLYVPLAGWAMIVMTLFLALCGLIVKAPLLHRAPAAVTTVLVLLGVALLWRETALRNPRKAMEGQGALTWALIQDFHTIQPRVRPRSRVIVLDDYFPGWDVAFIAELTFHDRTVKVFLQKKTPLSPAEIDKMDYIFTVRDGRLLRLKGA